MLTEERLQIIMEMCAGKGSITTLEIMERLNISESTARRDITLLDEMGKLCRVRGGAVIAEGLGITSDDVVDIRKEKNIKEKHAIGKYAASLIEDGDFVYIDAGTTTDTMIDYIEAKDVVFVTNAIGHAKKLSMKGYKTHIIGGEFKPVTEAIVGEEAIDNLRKYIFMKGFFGTNGVHCDYGITTPDIKEAMVKKTAIECCRRSYILADHSKIDTTSCARFCGFDDSMIITCNLKNERYKDCGNIISIGGDEQ